MNDRAPLSAVPPRRTGELRLLGGLALLFGLGLAAANIVLGNLNHDEGWYLLAALRVARGQFPYRDFLFTQGPVMPVVYGGLSPLWGPFGVLGGRVTTALFGLAATLAAARFVAALVPASRRREAALTVWLLTACVPVHSYFMAIPKTYGLAALLLLLGFVSLTRAGNCHARIAGILVALATATRLSLGVALPAIALALWCRRREVEWRRAWLAFGLSAAVTLALTYGVCWILYGDTLLFAQRYHAVREGGGLGAWLALRAGFASRSLQAYPLAWILGASLCTLALRDPATAGRAPLRPSHPALAAALWTGLGVTLLHAVSPFPYDDYQTPVMPLLAAVVAAFLWQRLDRSQEQSVRLVPRGLAVAALLLAAGSPLLMDWMVIRKDRFWFERKPRPDILVLRDVGRWLRNEVPPGGQILTQDAYVAVEAGRDVPAGLEMGPFSLFPDLPDDLARRHHVHTPATLRRVIAAAEAPVAATSGYTFAVACPGTNPMPPAVREGLLEALAAAYEPVRVVPDFGQAHTPLTLWRRRAPSAAP